MAFRYFDWECVDCGGVSDQLVDVPAGEYPPAQAWLHCSHCSGERHHDRLMSCPAPYMGEVMREHNPTCYGGSFDTMGMAPVAQLPTLPKGVERTHDNLKQHFESKEWKEARAQRKHDQTLNAAKKKRAAIMRKDKTVTVGNTRLPGDPKL